MTAAPIIARLCRAHGCTRPWRLTLALTDARCEIHVNSRVLVTPKMLRKAAQSSGVDLPPMSDRDLIRDVGRALAEFEAA